MKTFTAIAAALIAGLAGNSAALAQPNAETGTAQGTGTPLGTNLAYSSGINTGKFSPIPRAGTGKGTALGTGTRTGTNSIMTTALPYRNVTRSGTGKETAQGTGTPLGRNHFQVTRPAGRPASVLPRAGTGISPFRTKAQKPQPGKPHTGRNRAVVLTKVSCNIKPSGK